MNRDDGKYALHFRDLGTVLKERALEARQQRDTERTDFQSGRLMAYHEVISTMRNQADVFDLSPEDLNLHDVDLDRDILPKTT